MPYLFPFCWRLIPETHSRAFTQPAVICIRAILAWRVVLVVVLTRYTVPLFTIAAAIAYRNIVVVVSFNPFQYLVSVGRIRYVHTVNVWINLP